ncbi:MAG: GntR family transcriptional regulator [Alicyclobacillus macrosporangiidus]|uniref:GntR family transcriptional regulator n=1 Tax=Alicyclobacillus macrosporangiidus TaxID=392015 RepID=UPI0026E971BE|nr:GntR family transcriptional regulator [Alicyclobacillus macrosporangiidus]MCL6600404.1 GntR family transcriptional regulator [Alicyclobacillus macrosporangiidus]
MGSMTLYRSNREVLSDRIFKALRLQIITGQLRPGDRIVELRVAESFGTSQAPVREALQRLDHEGLVETIPHTGTFVSHMSFGEIEQLFEMRRFIEIASGKVLLRRARDSDVAALRTAYENMRSAAQRGDLTELVTQDVEFHRLLIALADRKVFLRVWNTMDGQIRRFISHVSVKYFDEMITLAERHEPILEAIQTRHEDDLVRHLTEHLALDESWRAFLRDIVDPLSSREV